MSSQVKKGFMDRTSGCLYQNVYMFSHQSITEYRRDLLRRLQFFACFNCEFWRDGIHRERHLPDGERRGVDMIKADGQWVRSQVSFLIRSLRMLTFWVFRISTVKTCDESLPSKRQLMESVDSVIVFSLRRRSCRVQ